MLRLAAALLGAALPLAAHAHAVAADATQRAAFPWLVALLVASALLYARGVARLWRRAGRGRGIAQGSVARFAAGWLVLAAALASPLDAASDALFSAHMVQHELLMVVAAPLLVLGRPLEAWSWGIGARASAALARATSGPVLRALWKALTEPVGAWCVHALALWAWHVPVLFEAALHHEGLHVLQHASFLGSALAFWWAVFGARARRPDGMSVALLFTTMMHTGALGALLAFAASPWYAGYAGTPALTALEDQQLGGFVMWVPGGFAYLAAGLAVVGAWLRPRSPRHRTAG